MFQYATLEDTIYLWFGSNGTSGTAADGASAVYDVREGGASSSGAPTLSGSATLLTHANYADGCYEVAIAATAANGFSANKSYGVFCTLAVDSQNPTGYIGGFRLAPVPSNAIQLGSSAQSATDLKDFADTGYDPSAHKVAGVVLVDTTTTNTDMRGTDSAATASALSTMQGNVTDILADTNELQTNQGNWLTATGFSTHSASDVVTALGTGSTLTALATQASVNTVAGYIDTEIGTIITNIAAVKSDTAAILLDTGTDGVVVATGSKTGYALTSAYDFAKGNVAMTEAYPTAGATMTPIETLYSMHQLMAEQSITSTTLTAKKRDQSTTAKTYTLDNATTPTSITET